MEQLQDRINEIVERITAMETNRVRISKLLRETDGSKDVGPNEEIAERKIINTIQNSMDNEISVVGVDGGIVKDSYHGLELILMRAVGVDFIYSSGSLKDVKYHPSTHPEPIPKISFDSFSEFELNAWYNFERQIIEIETAIECIKSLKPGIILLDGSIIPQYVTRPDNPILKERYNLLIGRYKEMFDAAEKMNVILAGVIEDSRSVKFCDILIRRVLVDIERELKLSLEKTRDSNLLYYVLKKGERTCVFNYSQNPSAHPILKEFGSMANNFFSFYIKTVEFDRPLKIDFLANGNMSETAEKISSLLVETGGHSGYGMPAVLIEADQRAKLEQKDLDLFYLDLISRIGNISSLFKLRREMRPF